MLPQQCCHRNVATAMCRGNVPQLYWQACAQACVCRHVCRCVCRCAACTNAWVGICIDVFCKPVCRHVHPCTQACMQTCTAMFAPRVHTGRPQCVGVCLDMCLDMCLAVCAECVQGVCADMCVDVCVDVCVDTADLAGRAFDGMACLTPRTALSMRMCILMSAHRSTRMSTHRPCIERRDVSNTTIKLWPI